MCDICHAGNRPVTIAPVTPLSNEWLNHPRQHIYWLGEELDTFLIGWSLAPRMRRLSSTNAWSRSKYCSRVFSTALAWFLGRIGSAYGKGLQPRTSLIEVLSTSRDWPMCHPIAIWLQPLRLDEKCCTKQSQSLVWRYILSHPGSLVSSLQKQYTRC